MLNLNQHGNQPPGQEKDTPREAGQGFWGQDTGAFGNDLQIAPRSHECKQLQPIRCSRRKAIRLKCLDCSTGNHADVERCEHTGCALHTFRTGKGKQVPGDRSKAIRVHCSWCSNSRAEVIHCPVSSCTLFPFRKSTLEHTPGTLPFVNRTLQGSNFQTSDDNSIPLETPK